MDLHSILARYESLSSNGPVTTLSEALLLLSTWMSERGAILAAADKTILDQVGAALFEAHRANMWLSPTH